jgi:hypothetical protein
MRELREVVKAELDAGLDAGLAECGKFHACLATHP